MLIHKNSLVKRKLSRNRLEPLRGCTNVEMLRFYRLTEPERKLLRVEKDNPGVIAVIA